MIARALFGALIASAVALASWRKGELDTSGAVGAIALGTVTVAAGWSWGLLLIAFFLSSNLLSRVGANLRAVLTAGVIAKGGARDVTQVLANGGMFGLAALLWSLTGWTGFMAFAAGALAAATADTWGTEVGTLSASAPRLVTTWDQVPTGTSGAITMVGMAASFVGAAFLALVAGIAQWPYQVALGAVVGGISGAFADSFIGARWQSRRRCPACSAFTERHVHGCGTATEEAGGVKWLDNDTVNVLASACGGAVSLAWWWTR